MKIRSVRSWSEAVDLTRPYTIAQGSISAVELFFVELVTDTGLQGVGSGSPAEVVTGESAAACSRALSEADLEWLVGRDPQDLKDLCRTSASQLSATPAAAAAVDMALHDLHARTLGLPLVEVLGRCHRALPTSITIGIKSAKEAVAEAEEYLARGFRCLKVKLGHDFEAEEETLALLRENVGTRIGIRVDANQGYGLEDTKRLVDVARRLGLELIEQPVPNESISDLLELDERSRSIMAADESMQSLEDARELARVPAAFGIFNIKLMKCGGISPALKIAAVAEAAGIDLMWGCMDESVVSISAAIHAAYASPKTRYLDLDGSLDLARDPGSGGFEIDGGMLRLLDRPGLGADLG